MDKAESRVSPRKGTPSVAIFTGLLAAAAFASPLWAGEPERASGFLLLLGALVEFRRAIGHGTLAPHGSVLGGAGITLLLALLLLNAPWFAASGMAFVVAIPFALDALRNARAAIRHSANDGSRGHAAAAALVSLAGVGGAIVVGRYAPDWVLAAAAGVRLAGTTINLLTAPSFPTDLASESVIADIGIEAPERLAETGSRLQQEEDGRVVADRGWVCALIAVLFAIHVSRMGLDRSALAILSPLAAVVGDIMVALFLAYFVAVPLRLFVRRATRPLEQRAWNWVLSTAPRKGPAGWPRRAVLMRLESRLRFSIRLRSARRSLRSALGRGLQIGLPAAAVIVASVPIWGMSWYFDTENWAAGIWNSWAASRTDTWREAMVTAVLKSGEATGDGQGFAVTPPGVDGTAPFSFIVIGDSGEGDASQHVLRDQLLRAAAAEDVRFVVLSSDVVYPTGAMKDYESRFWLPFKGVSKPIYAIPGNHDWYDALEGFAVTFFRADAARTAIRARIEADEGISSTTDATIEEYIRKADFLRQQYGVPTGYQQAPFFQVRTPTFTLLAIDTGVLRMVDPVQLSWLRASLEAARGTTVMAILGHPMFAGGHDVSHGDEPFMVVRDLLREYGARIVMGGDTHDLEYYREQVDASNGPFTMHHWVNGGGGAYLSFGTSLAWPAQPDTAEWAYYPGQDAVVDKIRTFTPWWKWPAWIWTRDLGAWPASAEWLSAMFDYNVAPFFQSFVVVTVNPADRSVTIRPWGLRGPLTWSQLDRSPGVMPAGVSPNQPVEWTIR